jgi:hypothetical protein
MSITGFGHRWWIREGWHARHSHRNQGRGEASHPAGEGQDRAGPEPGGCDPGSRVAEGLEVEAADLLHARKA